MKPKLPLYNEASYPSDQLLEYWTSRGWTYYPQRNCFQSDAHGTTMAVSTAAWLMRGKNCPISVQSAYDNGREHGSVADAG